MIQHVYINSIGNTITDLTEALTNLQEFYRVELYGEQNKEILLLMRRIRKNGKNLSRLGTLC